jgi:hypothetical protein
VSTSIGVGFDELPILIELREQLNAQYRCATRQPQHGRLLRAHRWRPLALVAVLVSGGATGALAATGATTSPEPTSSATTSNLLPASSYPATIVVLNPSTGAIVSVTGVSEAQMQDLLAGNGEISSPAESGG